MIAPPYDVLSSDEGRARAAGRPWSFLHISKPEIDLPPETDVHAPVVYETAKRNLAAMISAGVLVRDRDECFYAYRMVMDGHAQTGVVVGASVAAYDAGRIRKHELTRPDKEDDRVRQIEALQAHTGPVLLAYPASQEIDAVLEAATAAEPDAHAVAEDGVAHSLWVLAEPALHDRLVRAFEALPALYIADGHHRSAAASRVAASRPAGGDAAFLAVAFPHHRMRILPYNRILADLHGRTPARLLEALRGDFTVTAAPAAVAPVRPAEFGLYLPGQWYHLVLREDRIPSSDPVARLDVSLLSRHVLEPLFGIRDQRTDPRIDFVGGVRGTGALQRHVDSGAAACAFSLHATQLSDLMAVADAGQIMPPKSTWFEPKLADGMASLPIETK